MSGDFYSAFTEIQIVIEMENLSCRMEPVSLSNHYGMESGQKKQQKLYLGCLTKKQLIMISVAVGLVVLLIIIIVPAVVLTKKGTFSKRCATCNSLNCFYRFYPLQRLNIWDCVCLYCNVKSRFFFVLVASAINCMRPFHRSYSCLRLLACFIALLLMFCFNCIWWQKLRMRKVQL